MQRDQIVLTIKIRIIHLISLRFVWVQLRKALIIVILLHTKHLNSISKNIPETVSSPHNLYKTSLKIGPPKFGIYLFLYATQCNLCFTFSILRQVNKHDMMVNQINNMALNYRSASSETCYRDKQVVLPEQNINFVMQTVTIKLMWDFVVYTFQLMLR